MNSSCRGEPRPGTGESVGGSSLQPPYPPQSSDLPQEEGGGQRKERLLYCKYVDSFTRHNHIVQYNYPEQETSMTYSKCVTYSGS